MRICGFGGGGVVEGCWGGEVEVEGCGMGDWGGVVLLGCEVEGFCGGVCSSVSVGVLWVGSQLK